VCRHTETVQKKATEGAHLSIFYICKIQPVTSNLISKVWLCGLSAFVLLNMTALLWAYKASGVGKLSIM